MGSHSHRQTGRPSLVERSSRSPTARFPNHPAGSFNYPHLPNLPRLALFTLEKQREYQLTGDAPHQRERDEQITKLRYSLHKKPEDGLRYSLDKKPDDPSTADAVVEFVPVDFADKTSEGDTPKPFKEVSGEKSASEDSVGGKITDAEEGAAVAQLAVNVGKSGRINKLNFTPVDLSTGWANKTGLVQQILSNDIPALDLLPGADMFFNSTSDEFISFLPVEVTRRKEKGKRGIRRQRLKSDKKKMSGKEKELMKLLMAVENMNAAETRATIIARNREKRRRRKERREREKLKAERLKRQKMKKENSVLPPNGFHASNSQNNFMKKKYYSREPQNLTPLPLPEEKKSSLYSQILASYNKEKTPKEKPTRRRRRRRRQHQRRRKPRNCKVSNWGQWSDCNKSCGIGEAERRREVLQRPAHGGLPCPALVDYKWCGSARNCKTGYFNW